MACPGTTPAPSHRQCLRPSYLLSFSLTFIATLFFLLSCFLPTVHLSGHQVGGLGVIRIQWLLHNPFSFLSSEQSFLLLFLTAVDKNKISQDGECRQTDPAQHFYSLTEVCLKVENKLANNKLLLIFTVWFAQAYNNNT